MIEKLKFRKLTFVVFKYGSKGAMYANFWQQRILCLKINSLFELYIMNLNKYDPISSDHCFTKKTNFMLNNDLAKK